MLVLANFHRHRDEFWFDRVHPLLVRAYDRRDHAFLRNRMIRLISSLKKTEMSCARVFYTINECSERASKERKKFSLFSISFFLSLSANEQYFLRQEKENISAVSCSFQLNIGFSFSLSPSDTLQGKREEKINFQLCPKSIDRQQVKPSMNAALLSD